jgi:hypothetical protein
MEKCKSLNIEKAELFSQQRKITYIADKQVDPTVHSDSSRMKHDGRMRPALW